MTFPSLSADRREMAPSQRKESDTKTACRNVNAFQISSQLLVADTPQEAVSHAKSMLLEWVSTRFGLAIDPKDSEFAADNSNGAVEVTNLENGNVWAMRLDEKPVSLENGLNTHEVELIIQPGSVFFAYRLTISKYPGPDHKAPRAIPGFIHQIARTIGFADGGHVMDGSPWIIDNEVELEKFYAFLTNEERQLPVYMVTETARAIHGVSTLVDHEQLAADCFGVAHVALMTYQMGYQWTQRVGKGLSAYLGTVRTYQPQTPLNEENKHRHPLAMPERIASWDHEELKGPDAFSKFLALQAMQASASPQNWRDRFVPISALKTQALAGEFEFSEDTHWKEIERRLQRKITLLEARIAEMAQDALAMEQENSKFKAENTLLSTKLHQLERASQARPTAIPEAKPAFAATSAAPASITSIPEWIKKSFGNKVRLSDDALDEISEERDDHFENVALLKDCLSFLGNEVRDALIRSEDLHKAKPIKDALRALRATLQTIDEHELTSYEDDYTFSMAEHEDFMVRWVLELGTSGNDKRDLHIYFDFDINSQSILIGHLPNLLFQETGK